jgi:ribosomal protein S18 acetylase RimI-like enzyme
VKAVLWYNNGMTNDQRPTTEAKLRRAAASDLDSLLALYAHLHEQDDPLPPQPQLEAVWGDIMADPKLHYFVAEIEGLLVSSCNLSIVPNLTRGARPFGVIENVVTHADFRQRGLARAVMEAALEAAWEAGCYKVVLLSSAHRSGAHALYKKLGFDRHSKIGFVAVRPEKD